MSLHHTGKTGNLVLTFPRQNLVVTVSQTYQEGFKTEENNVI